MGFSEAVRTVYAEKYATFAGRAARSEYWWFILFYFVVMLVLTLILVAFAGVASFNNPGAGQEIPVLGYVGFALIGIFLLASIIPMIAVTVRRLHDRNMSGWWYLGFIVASMIPFLGIIASIALVVLTALRGTPGPNKFGADPLAAHNAEVFR